MSIKSEVFVDVDSNGSITIGLYATETGQHLGSVCVENFDWPLALTYLNTDKPVFVRYIG